MNVVVYKRRTGKEICRQPVFEQGAGSTDNSLIGAGQLDHRREQLRLHGPDRDHDGRPHASRASSAWTSTPTASAATRSGTRTRSRRRSCRSSRSRTAWSTSTRRIPRAIADDPWFLTALDFRTGKTVWERLTGQGIGFNNNYAPVTIGPDGAAYVGVLGGLLLVRDKTAPGAGHRDAAEDQAARQAARQARRVPGHGPERRSRRAGARCRRQGRRAAGAHQPQGQGAASRSPAAARWRRRPATAAARAKVPR